MPDATPQEVKPLCQMDDAGCLCGESQPAFGQPAREEGLSYLTSLFLAFAEHDEIVGIPHHRSAPGNDALGVMFDPHCGLQAV
jgi:hypothetical protein